jgi:hypothetical protein
MTTKAKEPQPEPEHKQIRVVRFMDKPGLRMIRAADWEGAGVPDHADTLWGPSNNWIVAKSDLGINEEQYARIILADPNFREEFQDVEE